MEEWRDIPGLEGYYQASSEGQIRSVSRQVPSIRNGRPSTRISPSKILKPYLNTARGGYFSIKISVENRPSTKAVHPLVCAAFHGPKPDGMQVAHGNGVSTDNRSANLRWATLAENHGDKAAHGTSQHGSRNHQAKLNESQVREIRRLVAAGHREVAVAGQFAISHATVRFIAERKRWAHIE